MTRCIRLDGRGHTRGTEPGSRRRRLSWRRIAALMLGAQCAYCTAGPARGQSVALTGVMGERALVVIDGAAPQVLTLGVPYQGVTLIAVEGDTAVIDIKGQRQSLRLGEHAVSVASAASGAARTRVVLHAGSGGHYTGTAQFNGVTLSFLLDTGASTVVMGEAQAERLGLNFRAGQRGSVATANGVTPAYTTTLDSVRLGDVEIHHVTATVVPESATVVLLGNSFLSHFRLQQDNDQLVLERRY